MSLGTGVVVLLCVAAVVAVSLMVAFGHRPLRNWFRDQDVNDVVAGQNVDDPGAP